MSFYWSGTRGSAQRPAGAAQSSPARLQSQTRTGESKIWQYPIKIIINFWVWNARPRPRKFPRPTKSWPANTIRISIRAINRLRKSSRKSTKPMKSSRIRKSANYMTSSGPTGSTASSSKANRAMKTCISRSTARVLTVPDFRTFLKPCSAARPRAAGAGRSSAPIPSAVFLPGPANAAGAQDPGGQRARRHP